MSSTPAAEKLLTVEEFDCLPEPDAGKLEPVEGVALPLDALFTDVLGPRCSTFDGCIRYCEDAPS